MLAADFEAVLRTVQPAVRLVSERHLLKVILYLQDHGQAIPANPGLPLWASRADLLAADVLPGAIDFDGRDRLLLLTEPQTREFASGSEAEQLRSYWRLLFRAAVVDALDRRIAEGRLTPATCEDRLGQFGPAAAREIRYVLEVDGLVGPAAGSAVVYQAFAALYLDLYSFNSAAVKDYFPSLPGPSVVAAALERDLDVASLLAQSRPTGAADPVPEKADDDLLAETEEGEPIATPPDPSERGTLVPRARDAEKAGNVVRAAILYTQAEQLEGGKQRERTANRVRAALGQLVRALSGVLHWSHSTQQEWRQALAPLLVPAAQGIWPRAARCLYELQKIPADLGSEVFAVDLVESIRTFGRRPIKRPLPHARDVMVLVRLRTAHRQLLRSRFDEHAQARLDQLFRHEMHRLEAVIRSSLTPVVTAALEESGLRPTNRVEEVAREKLVEELLDRVCERGYLRIGDLRDAVARNQLKMPDLAGVAEFLRGDALLRADTRLAYDLDGIYRRGELYLRWLQRGSSLFFGVPVGRFLSLYAVAPFLAAFLTLMAVEELRHLGGKAFEFASKILAAKRPHVPPLPDPSTQAAPDTDTPGVEQGPDDDWIQFDTEEATNLAREVATSSHEHHGSFLIAWPTIVGFGIFLLLVFHVPPFRRAVFSALQVVWGLVRLVLWEVPQAVFRSPILRKIRYSRPVRFVHRRLGGAIVFTVCVLLLLAILGASQGRLLRWGGAVFVAAAVAFNTPWGWVVQEQFAERLAGWWRVVRINLLPGLIATVLDLFQRLANWFERRLYAVDEWLRYRTGDTRGSLALKAVLGLLWFPVAYVSRFAFYLLIEPQINPVKHFPVVTVSHKVILPMTPSLADALRVSDATAAGILGCIPGVFGFIAWELAANWKLYRANRPDRLRPATIGSHGESMRGLLRPGFHSGTVPKLFRKVRHADQRGERSTVAGHHHELDHAAEAIHRFVERELVRLLKESPEWNGGSLDVATVTFGCQCVEVELSGLGEGPFTFAFENRDGRIEATLGQADRLNSLSAAQRSAFLAALCGLFDMAAAELFQGRERSEEPAARAEAASDAACATLRFPYRWEGWVARWDVKEGGHYNR